MRVVNAGGGIGGLTLAISLGQRGHDVTVVERRAAYGEEGAGIMLGANAVGALATLGLGGELVARGRRFAELRVTDAAGRVLQHNNVGEFAETVGPSVAIHRAELADVLQRNIGPGVLRLGQSLAVVAQRPDAVDVRIGEDVVTADLLVVAEGIGSPTRAAVFGDIGRRYSGYSCWRSVVSVESEATVEMWGRGKRLGIVPLKGGRSYIFLVANRPAHTPSPWGNDTEALRSFFGEFSGPATPVLAALTAEAQVHNDIDDLLAPHWVRGRVVLLGDAAHAMTPNLGQGAAMAIEDAVLLGKMLRPEDVDGALQRWERIRRPRVMSLHRQSYAVGRFAHVEAPWACWLRDMAMWSTPTRVATAALAKVMTDGKRQFTEGKFA